MKQTIAVTSLDVDEDGAVTLTTADGLRYMAIPGRGSGRHRRRRRRRRPAPRPRRYQYRRRGAVRRPGRLGAAQLGSAFGPTRLARSGPREPEKSRRRWPSARLQIAHDLAFELHKDRPVQPEALGHEGKQVHRSRRRHPRHPRVLPPARLGPARKAPRHRSARSRSSRASTRSRSRSTKPARGARSTSRPAPAAKKDIGAMKGIVMAIFAPAAAARR